MKFPLASTTPEVVFQYFQVSGRISRAVTMLGNVSAEGNEMYLVKSQTKPDTDYVTDLRNMTCSCPDWTHRGSVTEIPCKHLLAARLKEARNQ